MSFLSPERMEHFQVDIRTAPFYEENGSIQKNQTSCDKQQFPHAKQTMIRFLPKPFE